MNILKLWNTKKDSWNTKEDLEKVGAILTDDFKIKEITNLKRIGTYTFTLKGISKGRGFKGY